MPHRIRFTLPCALLGVAACDLDGPQSALTADGPGAEAILGLGAWLTALSVFVVVLVAGTLLYALLRRRAAAPAQTALDSPSQDNRSLRWILGGGLVLPLVTLTPLFVFALQTLGRVSPAASPPDLIVDVTGRQFWWEVRYVDGGGREVFETANEIHIPVGREVEVRLRSTDVIHSFWVPRLAPKLDNVPGHTNVLRLRADQPGIYRGQCAEYCGVQHAHMAFLVLAETEEAFRDWSAAQAAAAAEPVDAQASMGRTVFLERGCAQCHAVRGTPAAGDVGPDLSHVASRTTLAGGLLPNSPGHLAGWIVNPQALKAGSLMPALPLEPRELDALLSYLAGLR
jgi:cytochrome c oxidase subunit 2